MNSTRGSRQNQKVQEDDVILAVPVEDLESKDSNYGTETSSIVEEDIQRNKFLGSGYAIERKSQRRNCDKERGYDTDCPLTRVSRKSSERSTDRGYETDGATKPRTSERRMTRDITKQHVRQNCSGCDSGKRRSNNVAERGYETDTATRRIYKSRNQDSRGYETDGGSRNYTRDGGRSYESDAGSRRGCNARSADSKGYEIDTGSRSYNRNGERGYETDGATRREYRPRNLESRGYETDGGSRSYSKNNERGYETDGATRREYRPRNQESRGCAPDVGSRNYSRNSERGYETDGATRRVYRPKNQESRGYDTDGGNISYSKNGERGYETDGCSSRINKTRISRPKIKENDEVKIYYDLTREPNERCFDREAPLCVVSTTCRKTGKPNTRSMASMSPRMYSSFREPSKHKTKDTVSQVNSQSVENIDHTGGNIQRTRTPEVSRMRRTSRTVSSESSTRERKGSNSKKNLPWEDPFANPQPRHANQEKQRRIRYVDEVGLLPETRAVINQCNNKTPKTERKTKSKKECRVQ